MEREPTDYTTEPLSAQDLLRLVEFSSSMRLHNPALYKMLGNRGLLNLLRDELDDVPMKETNEPT